MTLTAADDEHYDDKDEDRKCTLIVSLMQKDSRAMRSTMRVDNANVAMTFDIYKVRARNKCCA